MKFDHIGLVVPSMARGRDHLSSVFGIARWTAEFADPVNGVYLQIGLDRTGICYELISPYGKDSPVERTLRARDRILNHVAYLVDDLEQSTAHMRSSRCAPVAEPKPAIAYGGRRIQFFLSPLAFIIELIEAPNHAHSYGEGRDDGR